MALRNNGNRLVRNGVEIIKMVYVKILNRPWMICIMVSVLLAVIIGFLATIFISTDELIELNFQKAKIKIHFERISQGFVYKIERENEIIQNVWMGNDFGKDISVTETVSGYIFNGNGKQVEFFVDTDQPNYAVFHVNRTLRKGDIVKDCFALDNPPNLNWYGGPEQMYQYWPVQKLSFSDYPYLPKELESAAIMERYWLSSKGLFVYINEKTPLFLDQNSDMEGYLCFIAKKELPFDIYEESFTFNYTIGIAKNARLAHMAAVKQYLHKPSGIPDERMIQYPIWSTWVRYGRNIDENLIREFADEIINYQFENAQLEIDDFWETCYGSLEFDTDKFPSISTLITDLKGQGFRVTLWIHPFINKGCEPFYTDALRNGYLVRDHNGSPDTKWWNSNENEAAYIDFTNPAAAEWFTDRLESLLETGIDSFKFDAGETSWAPPNPALNNSSPDFSPIQITVDFVRTVAKFGPMIEVRTGQGTQDLPVFVRMLDKDSRWGWNNGLPNLITTLLQMNINGYPFVLPDMIGGNHYGSDVVTKEMYIRWIQANVFMPSMQFSWSPWQFDNETVELARKFTELHKTYSTEITTRFRLAVANGDPVNPPLWWIDPEDHEAQKIFDQFLLGDQIVVAPVLTERTTFRDIYLPDGKWKDGNDNTKEYIGPIWIREYPAPLDKLPYFIRAE